MSKVVVAAVVVVFVGFVAASKSVFVKRYPPRFPVKLHFGIPIEREPPLFVCYNYFVCSRDQCLSLLLYQSF